MTDTKMISFIRSAMKLLTKHSDYAVRALVVLAKTKKRYLSSKEIARRQHIPYQFLRRILGTLMKKRFVVSREGGGGGFKLRVDPRQITVADVIAIFQGDIQLSDCMFRRKLCANRSVCVLRKEIRKIEHMVEKEFRNITLARLLTQAAQ